VTDTATAAGLDAATLADVLRVAASGLFDRWQEQIKRTGGCADPIRLIGATKTIDPTTRTVLHHYTTEHEPGGMLRVACGNRRASRCPACAWTYAGDTYHLIRAGLVGDPDKGTPHTVRDHPRVFATLTAPSFGPVHARITGPDGQVQRCRPRRKHIVCPHGRSLSCPHRHRETYTCLGQPLCPNCYDYAGAVVWNAHAPELWRRTTIALRRRLDKLARDHGTRVKTSYPRWPSSSAGAWSTSTPSSASTASTQPTPTGSSPRTRRSPPSCSPRRSAPWLP
jgi:replication initiator protein RepSA